MLKAIFNGTVTNTLNKLGENMKMADMAMQAGFAMGAAEAHYQAGVQAETYYGGFIPADAQAAALAADSGANGGADGNAPRALIMVDKKKQVQPALAAEMIQLLKELARRVMEGAAPVGELMAMIDTVQRMGIDVMDFMAMGPAFHSPQLAGERAA
jgi:hypothetical protein